MVCGGVWQAWSGVPRCFGFSHCVYAFCVFLCVSFDTFLGHVALLTEMFVALAESGVELKTTVIAVCIASEENSEIPGKE